MSLRRYFIAVFLALSAGGCALQQAGAYDQWREFHRAVNAMSAEDRHARSAQLSARDEQEQGTMMKLQLAYLMTLEAAEAPANADSSHNARVATLLDGVRSDHELVPVRDMLRQYLQLLERYRRDRQELSDVRSECGALSARVEELGREREALQADIAVCTDQLQALKEIESTMSASDNGLEVQR